MGTFPHRARYDPDELEKAGSDTLTRESNHPEQSHSADDWSDSESEEEKAEACAVSTPESTTDKEGASQRSSRRELEDFRIREEQLLRAAAQTAPLRTTLEQSTNDVATDNDPPETDTSAAPTEAHFCWEDPPKTDASAAPTEAPENGEVATNISVQADPSCHSRDGPGGASLRRGLVLVTAARRRTGRWYPGLQGPEL